MIIWGSRVRHTKLSEGEFYCPKCRDRRKYQHKKAANYFTLYFIPIFPMQELGEFVECQTCGTAFQPDVLNIVIPAEPKPKADVTVLLNSIGGKLEKATPAEFLVQELTGSGIDLDVARRTVNAAMGSKQHVCKSCGLTYIAAIKTCNSCGRELTIR